MITYPTTTPATLTTSIIGIGGAGSNVLRCLPAPTKQDLQLFCTALDDRLANTHENAHFVQLGTQQYHGMGTGGDPMLGLRAAQECSPALDEMVNERDLVVLVAGLGGGTGSGVTPYLAQKAKAAGCFLVSVVVMPFAFEGPRRREQAEQALAQLSQLSDLVFCFENDYMEALLESHTSARSLFGESDQILSQAAACVPMIATKPGMIHLGLDDLQNALTNENARCLFGIGRASGETRAIDAAMVALQSPLMNKKFLTALGDKMLVHIAGDESMKLSEIREVIETLRHQLQAPDLEILFGTSTKTNWNDTLRVTLISAINAETMRASMAEEITEEKDLEIELVAIPEPELEPEPEPEPQPEPEPEPQPEPEPEPQPEPAPEPEPEPSFDLQDEAFSLSDPMPSPKVKIKKEKKPIERPEYLFGDGLSSLSKISTTPSETKVEETAPVPPMFEGILPPTGEAEAPTPTEPLAPMDEGMATPEEEEDYSDNDLDTPPSLRSSGIAPWMKRD